VLDPSDLPDEGQVLRLARHRAARIGVDVNLHTGRWTFDEAVKSFMEAGGLDREVAEGETGLIRVFDLANVFSVMAIQTEDLAVRHADGFELIGRAALAESRGCSLMTV